MATFVTTVKFTAQGMMNIQETTKRAAALKAAAKKLGVKIMDQFWTAGAFDGLLVFDAPNVETASALALQLAAQGNVQTQTTRAFTAMEMDKILAMTAK